MTTRIQTPREVVQTSQPITINVAGDTACEPDETFSVQLSARTP